MQLDFSVNHSHADDLDDHLRVVGRVVVRVVDLVSLWEPLLCALPPARSELKKLSEEESKRVQRNLNKSSCTQRSHIGEERRVAPAKR